jgi:hypothetical protein
MGFRTSDNFIATCREQTGVTTPVFWSMDIEDSKGTRPDLKITNFNNLGKEMSTTVHKTPQFISTSTASKDKQGKTITTNVSSVYRL